MYEMMVVGNNVHHAVIKMQPTTTTTKKPTTSSKKQLSNKKQQARKAAKEASLREALEQQEAEKADLVRFHTCGRCGKPSSQALLRCARCHLMRYCSAECQRGHWKRIHKRECADLAPLAIPIQQQQKTQVWIGCEIDQSERIPFIQCALRSIQQQLIRPNRVVFSYSTNGDQISNHECREFAEFLETLATPFPELLVLTPSSEVRGGQYWSTGQHLAHIARECGGDSEFQWVNVVSDVDIWHPRRTLQYLTTLGNHIRLKSKCAGSGSASSSSDDDDVVIRAPSFCTVLPEKYEFDSKIKTSLLVEQGIRMDFGMICPFSEKQNTIGGAFEDLSEFLCPVDLVMNFFTSVPMEVLKSTDATTRALLTWVSRMFSVHHLEVNGGPWMMYRRPKTHFGQDQSQVCIESFHEAMTSSSGGAAATKSAAVIITPTSLIVKALDRLVMSSFHQKVKIKPATIDFIEQRLERDYGDGGGDVDGGDGDAAAIYQEYKFIRCNLPNFTRSYIHARYARLCTAWNNEFE